MNANLTYFSAARTFMIGLSIAVGVLTAASGGTIGIDARHGDATLAAGNLALGFTFDEFRSTVTSSGHTIVNLFSFSGADLAGLDAVILSQPMSLAELQYSTTEVSAIHAFVAGGRGLLLVGEGGFSSDSTVANLNALALPYGVAYGASPLGGAFGQNVSNFVAHPLTMGLSVVGVQYYRPLSSIGTPAVDLTVSGPNMLAAVDGLGAAGNVVLIGDTSMWSDPGEGASTPISFGSNRRLLQNTLSYIIVPEPSAYVLSIVGALGLFGWRRFGRRGQALSKPTQLDRRRDSIV